MEANTGQPLIHGMSMRGTWARTELLHTVNAVSDTCPYEKEMVEAGEKGNAWSPNRITSWWFCEP